MTPVSRHRSPAVYAFHSVRKIALNSYHLTKVHVSRATFFLFFETLSLRHRNLKFSLVCKRTSGWRTQWRVSRQNLYISDMATVISKKNTNWIHWRDVPSEADGELCPESESVYPDSLYQFPDPSIFFCERSCQNFGIIDAHILLSSTLGAYF